MVAAFFITQIGCVATGGPSKSISIGSKDWVQEKLEQFPELFWLANKNVSATNDYSEVKEPSYSYLVFAKKHVEFDRTILSLEFTERLHRANESDYVWLTQRQHIDQALSRLSFHDIHQKFLAAGPNSLHVIETAIVLGDLGKTREARKALPELSRLFPDQDEFYSEAIRESPEVFPSFHKLSDSQKVALQTSAHLLHFGHVTHLEGNASMFETLKRSEILNSSKGTKAFELEFLCHIADVAGAAGHITQQGSLVLTEPTYQRLNQALQAALTLKRLSDLHLVKIKEIF